MAGKKSSGGNKGSGGSKKGGGGGKTPKPLHVTPKAGDWSVKREGNQRASSTHSTQKAAIEAARKQAQGEGGQVKVHGQNGQIREERTYRKDPYPPKG